MSKRFRACDLNQVFLLPPSLQDWLPEGHLARFVAEVTNELDLSRIMAAYGRKDGRGMADQPRRESRLKKIAEAKAALEQEARERAAVEKAVAEAKLEERRRREEAQGKKFGGRPPQAPDPEQAKPESKA